MKPIEAAIVRIHAYDTDKIVGLGFLISENRVMTCAHVVADAAGIERDSPIPPPHAISMTFPLIDDDQTYSAGIVVWLPSRDGTDDIAVLELNEKPPKSTKIANFVTLDELWSVEFGAYGFPRYNPKGVWASGQVRGTVEGKRIQIEDIEGTSYFIEPGFSGSPVYSNDPEIKGVIGMVVSAEADPGIKAGFMIPSSILLTKMYRRMSLTHPEENIQAEPDLAKEISPIDMTENTSAPMPQIWRRKMRNRVVYIGKFEEMQRQLKARRVFVAHHFFGGDTTAIEDYRYFLKTGLEEIGYIPLFARDDSGTLLETLCQDIISTEAGIYDVTEYNANVLIELGMSIGLNQPTVVIAKDDDKPLINPLQELNPLRYTDRYDLAENIGDVLLERIQAYRESGMSPRFCAVCGLDCAARKPRQSPEKEYLLIGANPGKDKAIYHHLKQAVKNFDLNWQQIDDDFNMTVCQWVEQTRRSKLLFFHSKEGENRHHGIDNATTMIRTGIAIGAGTAWRMILKQDERMPTDLEGYKYVSWHASPTAFDAALSSAVRQLLNENRPGGIYDPLAPLEMVEDDTDLPDLVDAEPVQESYIFISYASGYRGSKDLALRIQGTLEANGVPVWLSRRQLETIDEYGDNWREQIIPAARAMLLVGAETSMHSKSVSKELPLAVENDVPVLLFHSTNTPVDVLSGLQSRYEFHSVTAIEPDAENASLTTSVMPALQSVGIDLSLDIADFDTTGETFEEIFQEVQNYLREKFGPKTNVLVLSVEDDVVELVATSSDDDAMVGSAVSVAAMDRMLVSTIGQKIAYGLNADGGGFSPLRFEPITTISRATIPLAHNQEMIGVVDINFQNPASEAQINAVDSFLPVLADVLAQELQNKPVPDEQPAGVYIAYRRTNSDLARAIYNELRDEFDVFLDVDDKFLTGDKWYEMLVNQIKARDVFLLLLTPSAIEYLSDPESVLHREVIAAHRDNKMIIPVVFDNMDFPISTNLPDSIAFIRYFNFFHIRSEFWDTSVNRLKKIIRNTLISYNQGLTDGQQIAGKFIETYQTFESLLIDVWKTWSDEPDAAERHPAGATRLWRQLESWSQMEDSDLEIPSGYTEIVNDFREIRNHLVHSSERQYTSQELNSAIDAIQPVLNWLEEVRG